MRFRRPATLLVLIAALASPLLAEAPTPTDPPDPPRIRHHDEPKVMILDDVTVERGEREGGVVCVSGDVRIDGEVDGDVVVVAGDVEVNGTIHGNLVAVLGDIELGDHAVIDGDLTNVAGTLDRGEAEVRGNVVNVSPLGVSFPGLDGWGWGIPGAWGLASLVPWGTILGLFLFFVAALVLAALVPDRIRVISEETPVRLFTALLFGLLGYMLLVLTEVVLCVTLIGIPIAILVYFAFVILKWMAMCGIFHYVGTRIARSMGRDVSFLGAILLGLVPFALVRLIPTCCFGMFVWFLVEIAAFGFLIITRLGVRPSPPMVVPAPPPPTPV